jgi:ABC-type glycerol-3-phosphate transport system substrate-binding protein
MDRSRRAVIRASVVGVIGAACGSDDLLGVPRIGTSPGKVIYATWGAPSLRNAEHWTLLSFEKNYTDLKVDVAIASDDERAYVARLQAMAAAGTDPDVMRLPGADAPMFYASAVTQRLDSLMRRDGFTLDKFAGPFDGTTYAKSWHAFPRGRTSTWGLFFDRDRFARAGVGDPGPAWTWEQFVDVARRLTDPSSDTWGLSIDSIAAFLLPWIWGAGADDLDRGGTTPQWEEPLVREALEWVHALRHVHHVSPPYGMHSGFEAMARGRVAMWFGCADDEFALRRSGATNFGFAPQPRGRVGASAAWHPDVVAIGVRAPSPDDAWEFLQYLVDPDTQRLELDQSLWLPQAKAITDDPAYRAPAGSPHDRRASIAGALVKPRSPVLGPSTGAMRRAASGVLDAYWRGEIGIDSVVTRANEVSRAALEG